MNPQNNLIPPESGHDDLLHAFEKLAIDNLPISLTALFEYFVKPPLESRLDIWRKNVSEVLIELVNMHECDLRELQNNKEFISLVFQSSIIASRTHRRDKLNQLKNVLINSAITDSIDDINFLFLRFIEELSPTHILLLKCIVENENIIHKVTSYKEFFTLFTTKYHKNISKDMFSLISRDLMNRGLIKISQDLGEFDDIYRSSKILLENSPEHLPRIRITEVGNNFIKHISHQGKKGFGVFSIQKK